MCSPAASAVKPSGTRFTSSGCLGTCSSDDARMSDERGERPRRVRPGGAGRRSPRGEVLGDPEVGLGEQLAMLVEQASRGHPRAGAQGASARSASSRAATRVSAPSSCSMHHHTSIEARGFGDLRLEQLEFLQCASPARAEQFLGDAPGLDDAGTVIERSRVVSMSASTWAQPRCRVPQLHSTRPSTPPGNVSRARTRRCRSPGPRERHGRAPSR